MQNMQKKHNEQQGGFWFGMMMGSVVGSSALYLLGTKEGRKKFRNILDSLEDIDTELIHELETMLSDEDGAGVKNVKSVVTDIAQVLDKIQSTIPVKKHVEKYFAKDGKVLK
jgi:gas vesicle protein